VQWNASASKTLPAHHLAKGAQTGPIYSLHVRLIAAALKGRFEHHASFSIAKDRRHRKEDEKDGDEKEVNFGEPLHRSITSNGEAIRVQLRYAAGRCP